VSQVIYDPDGRVGWIKRMNLQPLKEGLHYIRNHTTPDRSKPYRKIAEMPETVADQAIKDGWLMDPKALRQWVNDPANRAFKYTDEVF